MKTDIDIKDDIYEALMGTPLDQEVSGNLCKQGRETDLEDICISVVSSQNAEMQEAVVNVNIYVADIRRGESFIIDDVRCRTIASVASETLLRGHGSTWRFELDSQHIETVEGRNEHCINNRLMYHQFNANY